MEYIMTISLQISKKCNDQAQANAFWDRLGAQKTMILMICHSPVLCVHPWTIAHGAWALIRYGKVH